MAETKLNKEEKWLFKEKSHSEIYVKFRPKHPVCLYRLIEEKLKNCSTLDGENTAQTKRALDIGCGTGNSTFPLTEFIDEVIGIDFSSSQIEQAVSIYGKNEKLRFLRADVSEIEGMWSGECFDLITVGVAAHWMNPHTLFKAAHKFHNEIILPSMEESVREEFLTYKGIEVSMTNYFPNVQRDHSVVSKRQMTAEEISGFISSYGTYQKYLSGRNEGDEDKLKTLYDRLKAINPGNFDTVGTYQFLSASKK